MLLKKTVIKALPSLVIAGAVGISPALGAASNKPLNAVGPIEALNCNARTIQVLGVAFRTTDPSILASVCLAGDSQAYRFVAIAGFVDVKGSIIASRVSSVSSLNYAPGATAIYLHGPITSRKTRIGEYCIAGSRIVGLPTSTFALGDTVEVVGTQPVMGGPIVAVQMQQEQIGTGSGADSNLVLNGIVGSGVAASGIVGSGAAQNGIVGSGFAANGIVGSGVATSGIVGSGVSANGIVGSGLAVNGIVGSGVATSGIVGSGVSTNGIVGSGVAAKGFVGSGFATSGIVGSGISANGIVGSGVTTKGIVGSGVVTNGIVGSGVATKGIVGSG